MTKLFGTGPKTRGGTVIPASVFVNIIAPEVGGGSLPGQVAVIASEGTWSGYPAEILTEYRWLADSVAITGATSSSYTIQSGDQGAAISVEIRKTNIEGTSDWVSSSNSITVQTVAAPIAQTAPTFTGTFRVGETLTYMPGTYSGVPTPSVTAILTRNGGDTATSITSTYVVQAGDLGDDIGLKETASNTQGSASQSTTETTVEAAFAAPTLDTAPSITGGSGGYILENNALTMVNGVYSGVPAIEAGDRSRQWRQNGATIDGATAQSFTPGAAYRAATIDVVETVDNGQGSLATASSNSVQVAWGPEDQSVGTPAVINSVAQTLAISGLSFGGFPTVSASYAWRRNVSTSIGTDSATYEYTDDDKGNNVDCVVTLSNGVGSNVQITCTAYAVPADPAAPTIDTAASLANDGTGLVTDTWTATAATASGNPSPTVTTTIYLDGVAAASGTGATVEHTPTSPDDIGKEIIATSVADNGVSPDASSSTASGVFLASAPVWTSNPSVSAPVPYDTQTISVSDGAFSRYPSTITGSGYQWKDNAGDVIGETASSYTIPSGTGHTGLYCTVSKTNATGTGNQDSDTVNITVSTAATANTAPTLTGTFRVGQTLTYTPGTYTGDDPSANVSAVLTRDGVDSEEITSTYSIVAGDLGVSLGLKESATNIKGTATQTVSGTTVEAAFAAPSFTVAASLTAASLSGGGILNTATDVSATFTTTGVPTPSETYEKQVNGGGFTSITLPYTVAESPGDTLAIRVTSTNSQGSATSTTSAVTIQSAPTHDGATFPTISGDSVEGSTLTCTPAGFSGVPSVSYSYDWKNAGVSLGAADQATYVSQSSDVGDAISCDVTATNSRGSTSAVASSNSITVTASGGGALAISGLPVLGQTITITDPDASGSITYSVRGRDGTQTRTLAAETASFTVDSPDEEGSLHLVSVGDSGRTSNTVTAWHPTDESSLMMMIDVADTSSFTVVSGTVTSVNCLVTDAVFSQSLAGRQPAWASGANLLGDIAAFNHATDSFDTVTQTTANIEWDANDDMMTVALCSVDTQANTSNGSCVGIAEQDNIGFETKGASGSEVVVLHWHANSRESGDAAITANAPAILSGWVDNRASTARVTQSGTATTGSAGSNGNAPSNSSLAGNLDLCQRGGTRFRGLFAGQTVFKVYDTTILAKAEAWWAHRAGRASDLPAAHAHKASPAAS